MTRKMHQLGIGMLRQLGETYGTPLYVYDIEAIKDAYAAILDAIPYRPVNIRYAVMSNPAPTILETIYSLGGKFQVNSVKECKHAYQQGIISGALSVTTTNISDGDMHCWGGTRPFINFNSIEEIRRYGRVRAQRFDSGFSCPVGIRMAFCPSSVPCNATNKQSGKKSRIGVPLGDVPHAVRVAKKWNLLITGIHGYGVSNAMSVGIFQELMETAERYAHHLPNINQINLGGGFGIPQRQSDIPFDWLHLGAYLSTRMQSLSERYGRPITLEIEPGRALVGPAGYLITRVTNIKKHEEWVQVGVDCGFGIFPRPSIYGWAGAGYHEVIVLKEHHQRRKKLFSICGNTTLQNDFLAEDRLLPGNLAVGDYLAFLNAGAYGTALMSGFPGMRLAGEIAVDGKSISVLRLPEAGGYSTRE